MRTLSSLRYTQGVFNWRNNQAFRTWMQCKAPVKHEANRTHWYGE
jgi:hypothetical protein